jgi:hypothetical protein
MFIGDADAAVGVRVSIRPRLLEMVGSTVAFNDLHRVTVMGLRRFEPLRDRLAVDCEQRGVIFG